jgi:hypothetical protein
MTDNTRCAKCDAPLFDDLRAVGDLGKGVEQVCAACWLEINEQVYLEDYPDDLGFA